MPSGTGLTGARATASAGQSRFPGKSPSRMARDSRYRELSMAKAWRSAGPAPNVFSGRTTVGLAGFEPATPGTQSQCASKLRYSPRHPEV